ncbi:hypothetical protein J7T55_012045 [Diaporthe amygdali]|uniref:uncharacterized protein n=1 Tax=Phomopsis amygdali TaxID=1214568 RepID=UPI0022FE627B|nr:uncharacterized protein J7T55_012045 [Diaporthe amygdali]KAJ0123580.1 hypothetical protein J7T55_012045 [Diaporthe amygdali]
MSQRHTDDPFPERPLLRSYNTVAARGNLSGTLRAAASASHEDVQVQQSLGGHEPPSLHNEQASLGSPEPPGVPQLSTAMNFENLPALQGLGSFTLVDPHTGQLSLSVDQMSLAQPQQNTQVSGGYALSRGAAAHRAVQQKSTRHSPQQIDASPHRADGLRSQDSQLCQSHTGEPVVLCQQSLPARMLRQQAQDAAANEALEDKKIALNTDVADLGTRMADLKTETPKLQAYVPNLRGGCSDMEKFNSSPEPSEADIDEPQICPGRLPTRRSRHRSAHRSKLCPNCGGDHPLKACPCPNTDDGRLQACFECNTTDHAWFKCSNYIENQLNDFYYVYTARRGLCPLVHNKALHKLWREHFDILDYKNQQLNLQRPGPLTPQFVLRMLGDDPEVSRQIRYEHRLLPWDLSKKYLIREELRVKYAVMDPETNPMSHEVVYEGTETDHDQRIEVIWAQRMNEQDNYDPSIDRYARHSLDAMSRESQLVETDPRWPPDCSDGEGRFCMRSACKQPSFTDHCKKCGMETVLGIETLFNLNQDYGATLEAYSLLAQLSKYWHDQIHAQWVRVDINQWYTKKSRSVLRCVRHHLIFQTVERLQEIRTKALERVAEQLRADPNIWDVTSFEVLQFPECPECFAEATVDLGDYFERTIPPQMSWSKCKALRRRRRSARARTRKARIKRRYPSQLDPPATTVVHADSSCSSGVADIVDTCQ